MLDAGVVAAVVAAGVVLVAVLVAGVVTARTAAQPPSQCRLSGGQLQQQQRQPVPLTAPGLVGVMVLG